MIIVFFSNIFQWCKLDQILKTKTKTKTPGPQDQDQDRCLQDQDQDTGSKQRHLADLKFKQVNATVDLYSSDVPSTEQRNYK